MGNSAIRSVTVPTTAAATGPTEPVCVILDSTDASATSVSPTVPTLPHSPVHSHVGNPGSRMQSNMLVNYLCCGYDVNVLYFSFCASSWSEIISPQPFFLLQLVLSGRSARVALRSVRVSSRTRSSVTVAMAPVSVNLVTRATPARMVSTLSQCLAHQKSSLTFTVGCFLLEGVACITA